MLAIEEGKNNCIISVVRYSSLNIFMAHKREETTEKGEGAQKTFTSMLRCYKKQLKMYEYGGEFRGRRKEFKKLEYQRHVKHKKAQHD